MLGVGGLRLGRVVGLRSGLSALPGRAASTVYAGKAAGVVCVSTVHHVGFGVGFQSGLEVGGLLAAQFVHWLGRPDDPASSGSDELVQHCGQSAGGCGAVDDAVAKIAISIRPAASTDLRTQSSKLPRTGE